MTKRSIAALAALATIFAATALHTQTGCTDSPENPTVILGLVGLGDGGPRRLAAELERSCKNSCEAQEASARRVSRDLPIECLTKRLSIAPSRVCEKAGHVQEPSSRLHAGMNTGTRSGGLPGVRLADVRICSSVCTVK